MNALTLYPAIDLLGGEVVRLHKGDRSKATVYGRNAGEFAANFVARGARWVHVVDLDAAFDGVQARQSKVIRSIVESSRGVPVQLGGGLRDLETMQAAFDDGVSRLLIGTVAVENRPLLEAALMRFGPERIAVAIDEKEGIVKVRGWVSGAGPEAVELSESYAKAGVRWFLHSAISRDGTMEGPDLEALSKIASAVSPFGGKVVCAGGVGSLQHLSELRARAIVGVDGAVAGRALYEGAFTVEQGVAALNAAPPGGGA